MPQSPFRTIVYPPIQDLYSFRRDLVVHRASWENGEGDKYRDEALLDIGEALVEHCDFLEKKLATKVRIYCLRSTLPTLAKRHTGEGNEALEEESQAQKTEIAALKSKLEKEESQVQKMEIAALKSMLEKEESQAEIAALKSKLEKEERLGSNGSNDDGVRVEVDSQDAEKPKEGEGSLETAGTANLRKRGAEVDVAIDGKAPKLQKC